MHKNKRPGSSPKLPPYNADAVDRAIKRDPTITSAQARAIHLVCKYGRGFKLVHIKE